MLLRLLIVFEIVKSLILVKRILELKKFPKLDIKKPNQTILILEKNINFIKLSLIFRLSFFLEKIELFRTKTRFF